MMVGHVGHTLARASYSSLYKIVKTECKNYWDFVREMVSNAYDARAKNLWLFPHYLQTPSATPDASVLVALDNGCGMDYLSRSASDNVGLSDPPASSIDAFLQLGHSTNDGATTVGRFAHGSKQIMDKADAGFMLVTRTTNMPVDQYIVVEEDHIEQALFSGHVTWTIMSCAQAMARLRARFDAFQYVGEFDNTFAHIGARLPTLEHGTLVFVASRKALCHVRKLTHLDTTHRVWKRPTQPSRLFVDDIEFSALVTALRFATRHGSVMHDASGRVFPDLAATIRAAYALDCGQSLAHTLEMRVFCKTHCDGFRVPCGWPYVREKVPDPPHTSTIKGKRLQSNTGCWARLGPKTFTDDGGRVFAVLWNQNSFAQLLIDYESLSRRGNTRVDFEPLSRVSGGFVFTAMGVRICDVPVDMIENLPTTTDPTMCSRLSPLARKAFAAFARAGPTAGAVCFIDANLGLGPSRSRLSQEEFSSLRKNVRFRMGLANVLHEFYEKRSAHGDMLRYLLQRHERGAQDQNERDTDAELARRRNVVDHSTRLLLTQKDASTPVAAWLQPLCATILCPADDGGSHESQLQHIVSMCLPFVSYMQAVRPAVPAHAIGAETAYQRVLRSWPRVAMHYAAGVDATCLDKEHEQSQPDAVSAGCDIRCRVRQVEYKWELLKAFNHPFSTTDVILAWSLDHVQTGISTLEDKFECQGTLVACSELDGFGYRIQRVLDGGSAKMSRFNANEYHTIDVLSVREMIRHPFDPFCDVKFVPSRSALRNQGKAGKRPIWMV